MQAMLKAKSLWSAIERMLPLDTCDQDACRKEEKAMAALVLSLGDKQLMHVQDAATAADLWRKLKEDGDGMLEHINKVKTMAQQLEAIGAKLTLEFLTARLLHEETLRSEGQNGSGKDGRAFYGRSQISNTTMRMAEGPCFYCGKEGHFKEECRKRRAAEQQSLKATQASGQEAIAFLATSSRGGHWIINSGPVRVHSLSVATHYALGQPLDAAAQCDAVAISMTAATLETWHRRLGHLNH
ncbi:hypothetical protein PhCBS80983_g06428 [Powellomyces hirtus]|uniref:CCHC-type domain-containing protein n=1 Tax=Powellomyces hirtus TaxID=109895 RepID=A0A507DPQ1_9FUNG|nr:hypothetical protein PhCBS80983_g06428 [Powellomyces hirtus]